MKIKLFVSEVIFVFIIIFLFNACASQKVFDSQIDKSKPLKKKVTKTYPISRDLEILKYNKGEYTAPINSIKEDVSHVETVLLGERLVLSITIKAEPNKNGVYKIQLNDNRFSYFKVFRIIPISNWYVEGNAYKKELEYIPDALYALPQKSSNSFVFNKEPNEAVQLFIELEAAEPLDDMVAFSIYDILDKSSKDILFPVRVLKTKKDALNTLPSVIFNYVNLSSNDMPVETWIQTGLSDLQVNYVPTIYFDKQGNALTSIDLTTASSTGFRNTAYPWIKKGGNILLFWDNRYDKIAPLKTGGYIKPFTIPWKKAYKHLVLKTFEDLKNKFPSTNPDQISIYLADELAGFERSDKKYTLAQLQDLAVFIENELPDFKTLITYGYLSDSKSVKMLSGIDIHMPHIQLPELKKYKAFEVEPQSVYKSLKNKSGEKWMYSVETGKSSPLYKFRYYPMIAVAYQYEGYSWYAFADHAGSTWDATDGNRLDYSLYYHAEPKNSIYSYWNKRIGTSDYLTSSLRLKAIERGLISARILKTLISQELLLSKKQLIELKNIIENLREYDITSPQKPLFTKYHNDSYGDIERRLRILYNEFKMSKR
ncbi:hypothetical protein [uncultured Dokdonia sp.]|uniref:hypothetical protein n=1 Tax=uncultured Dokdonia sp. TaxID=575653 RepID=UPI0026112AF1|nr:hypothetical protein [uncultured Dokdonia sp.]